MLTVVLLAGLGGVHLVAILVAYGGPMARFTAGLAVILCNYGLRRLLFLDPLLADSEMLWLGIILLGDMTLALIVLMGGLARPTPPGGWRGADGAVVALLLWSLALALLDGRVPQMARLAHWKEEYFYLLAYGLARWNGVPGLAPGRSRLLVGVAGLAVAVALSQALFGPNPLDRAWLDSGRSVLLRNEALEGAHVLGNLGAGYIRPWGIFGNGTDYGVVLAFIAVFAWAVRRWGVVALSLAGVGLGTVRFTWAVALAALGLRAVLSPSGSWPTRAVALAAGAMALGAVFLLLAPLVGGSDTLLGRAFVTGTLWDRWEGQGAMVARLGESPALLLTGEGFGLYGSAALKFGFMTEDRLIAHHSRIFDLIQDGGVILLVLTVLPLVLVSRRRGDSATARAGLAFAWSLLLLAAVLGAKSAVIQTLFWASVGLALVREERP